MKKWLRYSLVFLLAYGIFLVAMVPSIWVYTQLRERWPALAMHDIDGSLWSGRAGTMIYNGQRIDNFSWSVQPLALLRGSLEIAWSANDASIRGHGKLGRTLGGAIYLTEVDAQLPVRTLQALSPASSLSLPITGLASMNFNELRFEENALRVADGKLNINQVSLLVPKVELGNFTIAIETLSTGVKANLRDAGGPLQAQGIMQFNADGSYEFNGNFAARDRTQRGLQQYLPLLGKMGADGRVQVSTRGKL